MDTQLDIAIGFDPSRRRFIVGGSVLAIAALTPACPFDGVTKAKAVRVAGFVIDLTKESLPLLDLIGAHDIAELARTKAIPALEKLKDALANANIPAAGETLTTVRNVLNSVANALLNLPESARRTTIIGILASVNVLLLTVQAFVESETTTNVAALGATEVGEKMLKVLEATRQ